MFEYLHLHWFIYMIKVWFTKHRTSLNKMCNIILCKYLRRLIKYQHPQITFHESDLTRSTYSQSRTKGSLRDLVSIVWSYAHGWPSWYTEKMCIRKFEAYSLPSLVRWMSEGLCIGLSNGMSHRKVPLGLKIWKLLEFFLNIWLFLGKSYS